MTAITAFPDILNVVDGDYRAVKLQAGAAITRGMVLAINSSGLAIPYPLTGTYGPAAGIAMDTVAIYDSVTVIFEGVARLANDTSTSAISVGSWVSVIQAGAVYAGAVHGTTTGTDTLIIGQAIETIAVSSYGKVNLRLR